VYAQPAATSCSLVGSWLPSVFFDTNLVFLANGTVYGKWQGGISIDNSENACNFRGNYTLAPEDGYFTYQLAFVNCPFFTESTDHTQNLNQLFCPRPQPTYDFSHHFSAGCFTEFDSTCTTLQFSNFRGSNAGESGSSSDNHWTLSSTDVPVSKSKKPAKPPKDCKLRGAAAVSATHVWRIQGFVNTSYTIQYKEDGQYESRITYSGTPSCYSSWEGTFSYGARYNTYPNNTAYPYTASSVVKHRPSAHSYCALNYKTDPALCTAVPYDTSSSCLITWNDFQFGDPCTSFKIVGVNGNGVSPTFFMTSRTDDIEDLVANSSASRFTLLGGLLVSIIAQLFYLL